jgi:hypothetical protein
MRLLTYALEHKELDFEETKQVLKIYLDQILSEHESFSTLLKKVPVNDSIRSIFNQTRFNVKLYPDTEEVLRSLRKSPSDWTKVNVFCLTYGDSVFQFQKALPLLKDQAVQAILLTKAKKGKFLEQVFTQNPFYDLDLTQVGTDRHNIRTTDRRDNRGIQLTRDHQKVIVTDDDPKQITSVDALAKKFPSQMQARRIVSPDQKRANDPTPKGEKARVIELSRDENLRLKQNMHQIQAELFEDIAFTTLLDALKSWILEYTANSIAYDHSVLLETITAEKFFKDMYEQENNRGKRYKPDGRTNPETYDQWLSFELGKTAIFTHDKHLIQGLSITYEESKASVYRRIEDSVAKIVSEFRHSQTSPQHPTI